MSHPPRRYWEDNYQARARDVPDPEAGGGMSAEGQTILEALDELCSACAENPRVGRIPERIAALEARLAEALQENGRLALEAATADQDWKKAEARLAEAERALREIVKRGDSTSSEYYNPYLADLARAALPSESEPHGSARLAE